jgi:hypothetical protein
MTSYALLLHGQLRKGSCVWSVHDFMNLRHASNANGGTAWSFGGIAANTLSRCGQLTVGAFPAWRAGADCHYVIKYYEESPNFVQFLAHVG